MNCVPVRSEIWSEKTIKAPPGLARSELSLTRIVFERAWELRLEAVEAEKFIAYEREMEKAIAAVDRGEAQMACLLKPVRVEQVTQIALGGGVLPQKSTDFYPKLLSGETIYKIERQ